MSTKIKLGYKGSAWKNFFHATNRVSCSIVAPAKLPPPLFFFLLYSVSRYKIKIISLESIWYG